MKTFTTKFTTKCAGFALLIVTLLLAAPARAAQFDIAGPNGSGSFGATVTVLPNGNIVVADPNYSIPGGASNVGAVYLYDGATLALISALTGSSANDNVGNAGVTALPNSNFVVRSRNWDNANAADAGAVTFGSGTTGASGAVSAANSLVGTNANDRIGDFIILLDTGNYLVRSENWNTSRGAVTFGSGTTGVSGAISSSNSLVGSTAGDFVGSNGISVLASGNYVVSSSNWDNGAATNAGAVTLGSGTTGASGAISVANSLVGTNVNDFVGSGGVTVLTNGNYVVSSAGWDNGAVADAGAATFGNGTTGVKGAVSASNSLVGSTANDRVGINSIDNVVALTNGNYVVGTPTWDNGPMADAGAATFGDGATGVSGIISSSNSLVGSNFGGDRVGLITALTNGNYVVGTENFDNGFVYDAGAVTFGNGTTGVSGTISTANSLIGSTAGDFVGRVTALTNGNYIVMTASWDNGATSNVGAITFGNGATGVTGFISASNSLIGSTAGDSLGSGGITNNISVLPNGNYLVSSPNWRNSANSMVGAITFGNGETGVTGVVSASNSLVGSTAGDVGFGGSSDVRVLANGNYVVVNRRWDNGAVVDAGAATFGNGRTGVSGVISSSNSLISSSPGGPVFNTSVIALTNGNYVVIEPYWDNGSTESVGAVTFGNGTTGISGIKSGANSLIGSAANDQVGSGYVVALTNGNYVVTSASWDNGAIVNAGAVTFGSGATGIAGTISGANSLIGSTANDQIGNDGNVSGVVALSNGNYAFRSSNWDNPSPAATNASAVTFGNGVTGTNGAVGAANSVGGTVTNGTNAFAFDSTRNRLIVGRSASNIVSVLFFNTTAVADGNINNPATFDNGLPNALVNAVIPNGRTVALNAKINVGQVLVECGGALSGGSSSAYVIGGIRKNYCAAANQSFNYAVGDPNNYSPLRASNVTGTGSLTVSVTDATLPDLPPSRSVSRFWSLNGAGISTDLTFTYTDADANGAEAAYKVFRRFSQRNAQITPSAANAAANTISVVGVSTFSDWGIGSVFAPTVADVSIGGRVVTPENLGLTNALVTLTDARGGSRSVKTGRSGAFLFAAAAGETYLLSVASKRYRYGTQIVTANENVAELIFAPQQ